MVDINGITFAYHPSFGNTLEDISFDIQQNQCIAILGNNGAGKSTLLKCIGRIHPAERGVVLVDGHNIFKMSKGDTAQNISYVPQSNESLHMTVFDAVLLGRKPYIKWDATCKDKQIVCDVLQKMCLEDLALRNVSELSGGEMQKVMLARALAQQPKLLLLDEPTSNLDLRNQHEVLRMIKEIAKAHNICVAIVMHDLNLAIRYCDRFAFLKDARLFSYGGLETMTPHNIEAVYQMHVHITEHRGVLLVVPFPKEHTALPFVQESF
ncbi:MAG: ABC transporter ATP-binding protein [Christensenellales bacterium]|jgi:iron complex transport system ATP-binding protein